MKTIIIVLAFGAFLYGCALVPMQSLAERETLFKVHSFERSQAMNAWLDKND